MEMFKYNLRDIPYLFSHPASRNHKGTYILCHGLSTDKDEYLNFYKTLSSALLDSGFSVLRFDFPGHGDAMADRALFTLRTCFYETVLMAQLASKTLEPGQPLNFFGTSFGAGPAVFAAAATETIVQRVTLLAPAVQYRDLYIDPVSPTRQQVYGSFFESALLRNHTVEIGDSISLNWENAVEFSTISLNAQIEAIADRLTILHGTEDGAIPLTLVQTLAAKHPNARLVVRPGMEHGFTNVGDETGTDPLSLDNIEAIVIEATRDI